MYSLFGQPLTIAMTLTMYMPQIAALDRKPWKIMFWSSNIITDLKLLFLVTVHHFLDYSEVHYPAFNQIDMNSFFGQAPTIAMILIMYRHK